MISLLVTLNIILAIAVGKCKFLYKSDTRKEKQLQCLNPHHPLTYLILHCVDILSSNNLGLEILGSSLFVFIVPADRKLDTTFTVTHSGERLGVTRLEFLLQFTWVGVCAHS